MFLMIASFMKAFVDFVMINTCFKNKRKYFRYKFMDSDDFSDLKEGLEPVKREREDQKKTNSIFQ